MSAPHSPERLLAPFSVPVFRRIWCASLLSNFGILVQGVGAAWTMTRLTNNIAIVALVQTALMAPMMLLALPAGAFSDILDRRVVCIGALLIAFTGATGLFIAYLLGALTPPMLLGFCFLVGSGAAIFGPSWQASVAEQVPADALPAAVALNGISYNLARSVGPAIGGVLVAIFGAGGAFLTNALFYLPLLGVLFLWKRRPDTSRLAPESFGRAILSGLRFMAWSPFHRPFVIRTLIFALIGSAAPALMPLVARALLGQGAAVYGLLLGAYGVGALIGGLTLPWMRARWSPEQSSCISMVATGLAFGVTAYSRNEILTAASLAVAGAAWTNAFALYSISIQISVPRWVAGRAVAIYQTAVATGVALGSWGWGLCGDRIGIGGALMTAGSLMVAATLVGLRLRLPHPAQQSSSAVAPPSGIKLDVPPRSGPIEIVIDYTVPTANAAAFHDVMQGVGRDRRRRGAYGWSIARDLADPTAWSERFHTPTWSDYQHLLARNDASTQTILADCRALLDPDTAPKTRRMLKRPAG